MYYDIPKCASSTIRSFFFDNDNGYSLVNPKEGHRSYLRFTFVRNPWDRMVSNWKMFTTQPFRIRQLRSMTDRDLSKFEDFVVFAGSTRNHHWLPQSVFLPGGTDFIGRLENFESDFKKLCQLVGCDAGNVPHENSREKHRHYTSFYTSALIERVADMYSDDIRQFGYAFGDDAGV
jgi:hypothetical protein